MAKGVKHYMKNGTEWRGKTHKMPNGQVHTGATHSASSKRLYHMKDLSKSVQDSIRKSGPIKSKRKPR